MHRRALLAVLAAVPTPSPPIIDPIDDTTATVGVEKAIVPNNSGGIAASWSATGLSDGAEIDPLTGVVTWTPTVETTLNITITATNANGSDDEAVAITSSNPVVNNAPVILLDGVEANESGTFTEGDGATTFLGFATLTDSDDTDIASITIVGTSGFGLDGASDIVSWGAVTFPSNADKTASVTAGATTVSVAFTTADKTFTCTKSGGGEIPKADGQTFIRAFAYNNTATPPDTTSRVFTFTANDGDDESAAAQLAIAVVATPTSDLYQVRRTTDDTLQTVTLTEVDDGTLDTFVGAGDGALATWYDDSGNANHVTQATTTNQPKVALAGAVQEGVVFQSSDYMDLGARLTSGTVTQLSLAFWMKVADSATTRTIACEMTTTNSWRLQLNASGQLSLYRNNGSFASIVTTTTTDLDDGTWKHVVVVCDGVNVKFYVDGTLDTEIAEDILSLAQTGSTLFELGADRVFATLNGTLSDFRLWQAALSSVQVASVYAGDATGSPLIKLGGNYPAAETPPPPAEPTYHDNDDLTNWANFESRMLSFGATHGDWLIANHTDTDNWGANLNRGYYDFGYIAYTIAEYIDADYALWRSRGDAWLWVYDYYVNTVASGGPAGWFKFTGGLRKKYELLGDTDAKDLIQTVALGGAFNPVGTPLSQTEDAVRSREVAYGVMNFIDNQLVGNGTITKLGSFMDQIFAPTTGHFAQWFDSPPYVPSDAGSGDSYFAPFMWGISCLAGIQYLNDIGPDSRVLPAIAAAADWVRPNCWSDTYDKHLYRTNDPGWEWAPDLELFVAPVYWWLWKMTGEADYKTWGDASFNSAFKTSGGAYLTGGKQFTECFRWTLDGLLYRAQGDAAWL